MPAPKIRLLYYKNAVEECLGGFFEERGDVFARDAAGRYVLTDFGALERRLKSGVPEILKRCVRPFDVLRPEYTFVIGGCAPRDNFLLGYRTARFPKKLAAALDSDCPRYVLKERDIIVDMRAFDAAAERIFSGFFRRGFADAFGRGYSNVFAIRHRRLDCYSMFKVLKYVYGRSNCVNAKEECARGVRPCLTAVNDLIDACVNNKAGANRSAEFKAIVGEVRQFADRCIGGVADGGQG